MGHPSRDRNRHGRGSAHVVAQPADNNRLGMYATFSELASKGYSTFQSFAADIFSPEPYLEPTPLVGESNVDPWLSESQDLSDTQASHSIDNIRGASYKDNLANEDGTKTDWATSDLSFSDIHYGSMEMMQSTANSWTDRNTDNLVDEYKVSPYTSESQLQRDGTLPVSRKESTQLKNDPARRLPVPPCSPLGTQEDAMMDTISDIRTNSWSKHRRLREPLERRTSQTRNKSRSHSRRLSRSRSRSSSIPRSRQCTLSDYVPQSRSISPSEQKPCSRSRSRSWSTSRSRSESFSRENSSFTRPRSKSSVACQSLTPSKNSQSHSPSKSSKSHSARKSSKCNSVSKSHQHSKWSGSYALSKSGKLHSTRFGMKEHNSKLRTTPRSQSRDRSTSRRSASRSRRHARGEDRKYCRSRESTPSQSNCKSSSSRGRSKACRSRESPRLFGIFPPGIKKTNTIKKKQTEHHGQRKEGSKDKTRLSHEFKVSGERKDAYARIVSKQQAPSIILKEDAKISGEPKRPPQESNGEMDFKTKIGSDRTWRSWTQSSRNLGSKQGNRARKIPPPSQCLQGASEIPEDPTSAFTAWRRVAPVEKEQKSKRNSNRVSLRKKETKHESRRVLTTPERRVDIEQPTRRTDDDKKNGLQASSKHLSPKRKANRDVPDVNKKPFQRKQATGTKKPRSQTGRGQFLLGRGFFSTENSKHIDKSNSSVDEDDVSWLQEFADSLVGGHSRGSHQPSMADFQDIRLGTDLPPTRIGGTGRLEECDGIASDSYFLPIHMSDLDSLTNSVSFDLSNDHFDPIEDDGVIDEEVKSRSGTDSLWTDAMSSVYSTISGKGDWIEIVRASKVLERYHFGQDATTSLVDLPTQIQEQVHKAANTFRKHGSALNVHPKELYAAVRDDPRVLNQTTVFDIDEHPSDEIWRKVGRYTDRCIDRYLAMVESIATTVQKDMKKLEVQKPCFCPNVDSFEVNSIQSRNFSSKPPRAME